jgi:GT2 family glycosyltransferase
MGVAAAANLGWASVDAAYYIKLDNDVAILKRGWLAAILRVASDSTVGMAGYQCVAKHAVTPVMLPSGEMFHESSGCNGALACIPRAIHELCGFWNEDYGAYGYEDLDYNNRVRQTGRRIGYHPDSEAVRHMGWGAPADAGYEAKKYASRSAMRTGEKLYLLNKFLFETGVRDIRVARRFLPEEEESGIVFKPNPAYAPISRLQRRLLRETRYSVDGDVVRLDLGALAAKRRGT